ncbi:transporter, CPA2 family [Filimonas lacunae]|uniref:Transporter, CPA2 family n=1 Tax=Filimonas lacunae TaxID=477680 RepID=A0A173MB43_9BACT|nr:cation:proton antiporter [Filimonas lacunae]BAV04783.1 Na+/H+-exchanging protein [Filimonas lacunae]SIT32081.1 transporter, CPA2 family [Filimonas lacunae]
MKKYRNLLFYVITIAGFSGLIYYFLQKGRVLESEKVTNFIPQLEASTWQQFKDTYIHNLTHPLAILLLQIITIILVARAFGFLCKKIKQPTVIGEIAAGIFLGPSFLAKWMPEVSGFLFPVNSLSNLSFLSQIGLILFMFVIGMELDLKVLKNKAKDAVVVSHASIIFPFTLGIALSYFLYRQFAPGNINFLSFALFTGISMSITAFPVLARIVQERGLSKTKLGTIVITCAAADDITAWCILAVVIAIVKAGSVTSSLFTILMAIAYVLVMIKLIQPFLKRIGDKYSNKEALSKPVVAVFFITLLLSSFTTEVIGIHALFGAFMAGVIMPANISFRNIFIEKVEDVALVLLLPLFFVFTGLRTQIGLLNDVHMWQVCGVIIAVAVTGKFVGSALAARFVGQSWRESLSIGALMNTRGLMELIVLNIGYDLGVLKPEVFAMMVLMALATTFMTGPILDLINRFMPERSHPDASDLLEKEIRYNILVSFGSAKKGVSLLQLANNFVKKATTNAHVTALHLSPSSELNQYNQEEYERESFQPIQEEAQKLSLPITPLFKPTLDITEEIIHTANEGHFDLLLIGVGSSVFEGTLLGKILGFTNKIINPERLYDTITGKEKLFDNTVFYEHIKQITRASKVPVGIYIDRNTEKLENIFIPILSISDSFLLIYAQKLIHNSEARVVVLDVMGVIKQNPELKETIRSIEQIAPNHIALYSERNIEPMFLDQQDLMLISMDSWRKTLEAEPTWLSHTPAVLIIKP